VIRVLIAAAVGLSLAVAIGPWFIDFLRRNEFGQHIREEGPQHHIAKQGTPTMGGLLILFAATIAFLIGSMSHFRLQALTVLFTALACGGIGFLDDFIKLTHKRSLGLPGRWKLLLLAGVTLVVAVVAHHLRLSTDVYIPVVDVTVPLSYGWYVFLFFVIAGAANGTNLADGVDGLLAGTGIIALFTFMAMNVVSYVRSGPAGHRNLTKLDLAIVGAALIGAAVGFLWFNAFPAEVIMGDTGSMAFGGALAAFAIMMKVEVLLLLIGGIFVIEALSVMIQVFSFKRFGRRVFLMAPIHHHFEMKAWSETKITVRFWIIGGLLCAVGFALYYRYYFGQIPRFRRP
jgi:phospho-N-acetylmuramoyl-pentapeptide-transferase